MHNPLKYFRYIALITALLVTTGCDEQREQPAKIDESQWPQEIQKRFDILQQMAGGVECIALARIADFPYQKEFGDMGADTRSILKSFTDFGLLTENIEEVPHSFYKNKTVMMYQYDLTDLGRSYFKKWPQLSYSGFCFGNVTVTDITAVNFTPRENVYSIKYNYTIDNVPDGIYDLIKTKGVISSSFIAPEVKNRITTFSFDEQLRLYSQSGIALVVHQAIEDRY